MKQLSKYSEIKELGTITNVVQHTTDLSPGVSITTNSNIVKPDISWKSSVIEVTYTYNNLAAKSFYYVQDLSTFLPDYKLEQCSTKQQIIDTCESYGILRSKDLDIIYGQLPPKLKSLRATILSYLAFPLDNLDNTNKCSWPRAFAYAIQLLSSYGLISFYRYLQPLHCKNYTLLDSTIIPDVIPPNFISDKAVKLVELVASCKAEMQKYNMPLDTLDPIKECLDSNREIAPLLEGICLVILASLVKGKEYSNWIIL
jgi:hypothetical protein